MAREALRSGRLGEPEQRLLNELRSALGLTAADAKQVAAHAHARAEEQGFQPGARLDPGRLLAHARQQGMAPEPMQAFEECLRRYQPPPPTEESVDVEISTHAYRQALVVPEETPEPTPEAAPEPSPEKPRKLVPADSGGGDVAHTGPFGDPSTWSAGDVLLHPLRFASRDPGLWGRLTAFQGFVYVVPFVNVLAEPYFAALIATAVEDEALGQPAEGLRDLVARTAPLMLRVYLTFGCMLLVFGLALALSLGAQFVFLFTIGGWPAMLLGAALTATLLYQALCLSLYAVQITALGGVAGFPALVESRDRIRQNRAALLGYDAIGTHVFTGGVKYASVLLLKPMTAALYGAFALVLGTSLGGWVGLPFALVAVALLLGPAQVYRQATWAALYLRGR